MSEVGKRYARAAVEVASEAGGDEAIDRLAEGLRRFADDYASSVELRELMLNPAFRDERSRVLSEVLKAAGASEHVERLISLLAESDRVGELESVAIHVEAIADERASRMRAHVRSALDLTADQRQRVADALHRRLGRRVVVDVEVDTTLLGGLVCQVGDLTFDSSLKRQLELLRDELQVGVD